MRIRFQADADLNQAIVAAVLRRLPETDFRSATDAGLPGLHDLDVLALAAREGRLLVTHDQNTMPKYFGELHHQDRESRSDHRSSRPCCWQGPGGLGSHLERV
jgi:hypothetical protein